MDHAKHKNPSNENLTLAQSKIDHQTQMYCFYLAIAFFIDFNAVWFDQYSKYFAGLRLEEVATQFELLVQRIADFKVVTIVVTILAESFLLGQYMK